MSLSFVKKWVKNVVFNLYKDVYSILLQSGTMVLLVRHHNVMFMKFYTSLLLAACCNVMMFMSSWTEF